MTKRYDELFIKRSKEPLKGISSSDFLELVRPKVEVALTWEDLKKKLERKKTLNVKLGIDPTGSELHLGHLVPVILLDLFARAGHHIDLVIGDFTARVGDPSGRETSRQALTASEIEKNFSSYKDQIKKYIDVSKITLRRNSEWLENMNLGDFFAIIQRISLSDASQREDFRARTKNNQGVSLAEACYGVLMGLDSVSLLSDVELGGIDQLLNFGQCRSVQEISGMEKEAALTTPILEGTSGDGKKMSKSLDNYIALDSASSEKFGKIMSIPDELIVPYFKSFAIIREDEIPEIERLTNNNPLEAKKQLATFIASLGEEDLSQGEKERTLFEDTFSQGRVSEEKILELKGGLNTSLFDALNESGHFKSKSELRRLFSQNAVTVRDGSGEKILKETNTLGEISGIVRVGKRKFFKIIAD